MTNEDPTPPAWSEDIFSIATPTSMKTKEQIYREILIELLHTSWYGMSKEQLKKIREALR